MKRNILSYLISAAFMFSFSGCEDYLNIPAEAALYEEDVFRSYEAFQGYQDEIMEMIVDWNRHGAGITFSHGGECVSRTGQSVLNANLGLYSQSQGGLMAGRSPYFPHTYGSPHEHSNTGIYTSMWECLRIANNCLEKLESGILVKATQEQRNWLEGQALFFRAYWHYEYMRSFGTIPYIDLVIPAEKQLEYMNRHWSYEKDGKTYFDTQAVLERIVEDMEAAAELLPAVYDDPNINWGRPTKFAALGYKAKALQLSVSPLINYQSNGIDAYDNQMLNRAARACQDVIDLAKSLIGQEPEGMPQVNADGLTSWEDIRTMYCTFSGRVQPGTMEVLFKRPSNGYGNVSIRQTAARVYGEKSITNQDGAQGTCQYVDKFEMADGTLYKPEYDKDPNKRWVGRDPRFDLNFYVHGDSAGNLPLNVCTAARTLPVNCYTIRKYLPDGANKDNAGTTSYANPLLRLADIYLAYAEAAYESTGSYTQVPTGCSMTAEEAVNVVRSRAGQPLVADVLSNYAIDHEAHYGYKSEVLPSDEPFRRLYRNEYAVELAFEGVYWFNLRRWRVAHHKDGTPLQVLQFDLIGGPGDIDITHPIDDNTIRRVNAEANGTYTFKEQHYWVPFRNDLISFTSDWDQNPGW